jgi:hypothetical protein
VNAPRPYLAGYLRADSDDVAANLESAIRLHAIRSGHGAVDAVYRDPIEETKPVPPGLARCLHACARAGGPAVILIPHLAHLSRVPQLSTAMIGAARSIKARVELVKAPPGIAASNGHHPQTETDQDPGRADEHPNSDLRQMSGISVPVFPTQGGSGNHSAGHAGP